MNNSAEQAAKPARIAVMGGGAWGTALAAQLARKAEADGQAEGANVMLLCRAPEQAGALNAERQNKRYLPDIILPSGLWATADASAAFAEADIVLAAVPAQQMRAALAGARDFMPPRAVLVLCSKGIERGSGLLLSQIAREIFPENPPPAVLSGPSFAADVARGLPTALTLAAEAEKTALALCRALSSAHFRCYASTDIIGVELGGALKNVLALLAGMAAGRGLGASAQAALITRGFAELRRVAAACGAKAETMTGLAVLGDLVLTCSSAQSRNFAYGRAFAAGAASAGLPLAEGAATAPAAAALCAERGIDAPLIFMAADILAGKISLDAAIGRLISRPLKFED